MNQTELQSNPFLKLSITDLCDLRNAISKDFGRIENNNGDVLENYLPWFETYRELLSYVFENKESIISEHKLTTNIKTLANIVEFLINYYITKPINCDWGKKIHVASSMSKKQGQFTLMIGRWQSVSESGEPALHEGHIKLFEQVLLNGENLLIAIRDVEPDEKNPFTAREIYNHIVSEYNEQIFMGRVRIMILPEDISAVAFGRGVGYDIIEYIPPADIAAISATKIREKNRENTSKETLS